MTSDQATPTVSDNVVDPTIGAHVSLIFSTTPDQQQIDQILATIKTMLDLAMQIRQQVDNGKRIVFVPPEGVFADDEERLEALAALAMS